VSRAFVFSAALPPASAAAAIAALDVMEREPERVRRVQSHTRTLRARLRDGGIPVREDPTPIIPVITGDDVPALRMARALYDRGVFVPPIVSPAVPPKTSRLRVTVTAAHSDDEVAQIGDAVVGAWREVMLEPTVARAVPGAPRA
ncbi:MAG: aminotransferase class I/II-fold pyridoxal phosphate-dependent enzyme, partial [bacterium]